MSNQNDLDDQLYILLASMKEYREAIADDNKRLERFYEQIATNVLKKTETHLENTNKRQIQAINKSIQELNQATSRLDWRFMGIYAVGFISLLIVFFLAIFLYVPSMDEIKQRRMDITELRKYPVQIRFSDNETLVKIMTKNCYSFQSSNIKNKTYDWCQIDPKKY